MNEELIGKLWMLCVCGRCTTCKSAAALESADKRIAELENALTEKRTECLHLQKHSEKRNKDVEKIKRLEAQLKAGNFEDLAYKQAHHIKQLEAQLSERHKDAERKNGKA